MSRFYYAVKVEENKAWFDDHEYRHFQVMRVEEGQRIVFTDGNGALYAGIVSFARDRTTARITEKISQIERSPSQRVAVGIAHAQWDREEVLIEKGTELGVTDFYLFPSRYSKYRDINLNKVSYTLRKAIKQSENPLLPTFEKFGRLEEALALVERYPQRILLQPSSPTDLFVTRRQSGPVLLFVGPEGGFHPDEVQLCIRAGFTPCSIGKRILRLETAALCGFVWATLLSSVD